MEQELSKITIGWLKSLCNGEITNAVKITAHKFSKSMQAAIEKTGGSISIIEVRVPCVRNRRIV